MLVQITPPAVEPITLAQARLHLKLTADDPTNEDSLIEGVWIPAARSHAEMVTARSFITQGWRLVMDSFPGLIQLERGPVQRIDSIVYRDTGGVSRTIAWAAPVDGIQRSTDGTLIADLTSGVVATAFGATGPIVLPELGALAVNYTAGYGDTAAAVPQGIKQWLLLRIGALYENREEVLTGSGVSFAAMPFVDSLLAPYSIVSA